MCGPTSPRNIIILLDGTANQFSGHNSNLIKLLSVIKADESQLVYYSSGLGMSFQARGLRLKLTKKVRCYPRVQVHGDV